MALNWSWVYRFLKVYFMMLSIFKAPESLMLFNHSPHEIQNDRSGWDCIFIETIFDE